MTEYCAECHRVIAREDRVERDGEAYHRQCAPDDVAENNSLDDLRTDGGLNKCASVGCNNPVATRADRCDECRRNDLRTDGGIDALDELRDVDVEAVAAEQGLDEDGLRMHVDLVERVVWAVNEDDVDLKEAQAAVESLADDLQEPAEVPDEWILRERFGVVPAEDGDDPGVIDRLLGWL